MKNQMQLTERRTPISIFQTVIAAITTRQAAEFYGQSVTPNGMTLCPFHDDHHPSMKVDERYYCFACNETGDVIDYVARLFDLSNYEAVKKLQADFCIHADTVVIRPNYKSKRDFEHRCFIALNRYYQVLKAKKRFFAPQTVEGPFTFTYGDVDAEILYVEHLLNVLIEPYADRRQPIIDYLKEYDRLSRLEAYVKHHWKEVKT